MQFARTPSGFPVKFFAVTALIISLALLASCGGSDVQVMSNPPVGAVSVTVSDPPKCRFPAGDYKHVYVSVRSVQAHISSTADDNTPGWQELATGLATQPIQVDLLALPQNGCTLATLGANPSLPVGDYQQIRLLLVANNASGNDPRPATNACGNQGFNCVVLSDDSIHQLDLSSQANTGLKIPPGQVVGGPIRVTEGSNIDLNIDFNTCASIVPLPGNRFRLRPTLTAGQVSTTPSSAVGGQIVDGSTMMPIVGGSALVAIEQADSTGVDRIVMEAMTDSNGNFSFCPVPMGMFDVVSVATDGSNRSFGPTVVLSVATGASLGKIPLVGETATPPAGTAAINGTVTASSGTAPNTTGANVDVSMSGLQTITIPGGMTTRDITIPLQGDSTPVAPTMSGMTCPAGTNCATYKLNVPANNPSVGTFSSGGTMFSVPATGDVLFKVQGRSFMPMTSTAICSMPTMTTDKDSADMPLKVIGGMSVTAKQLDFTGCM